MKATYLGWVVAVALATAVALTGFQGGTTKIGVVDMTSVFRDSEFAKQQSEVLKALAQARQEMLQFVDEHRTFTTEQATKFHDLYMKAPIAPADKAELDKIKGDVVKADSRLKELQTKPNPTQAESAELSDLSRRVQTTNDLGTRWSREAQDEMENKRAELQKAGLDKIKDAIKQVASSGQYTVVYISEIAPYGANDLTQEVLKAMNKK